MEKQQSNISEEITKYLEMWKRYLSRSQIAYEEYKNEPILLNANRIYQSNKALYNYSEMLYYNSDYFSGILDLLYHLDDWFAQYSINLNTTSDLADNFIFNRREGAIAFPSEMINNYLIDIE